VRAVFPLMRAGFVLFRALGGCVDRRRIRRVMGAQSERREPHNRSGDPESTLRLRAHRAGNDARGSGESERTGAGFRRLPRTWAGGNIDTLRRASMIVRMISGRSSLHGLTTESADTPWCSGTTAAPSPTSLSSSQSAF